MMNDGEENENTGVIDITGGDEKPSVEESSLKAVGSEHTSPVAAATVEASDVDVSDDVVDTPPTADMTGDAAAESSDEPSLKTKLANAAEVARIAALKASNDVASKVTSASKQAYEATGNMVRRMSKKGGDCPDAETHGKGEEGENATGEAASEETQAAAATEGGEDSEDKTEKVSMWSKVRRASGTAALKAAGAAQAAYKAAEPVGQKVADGAKTAYGKAKPVAEMAAQKTSEGATAAWLATKGSTSRAIDRVRSMSGAPGNSVDGSDRADSTEAAPGSTTSSREDPDIGEISSSVEPEASSESKPDDDDEN